ncbi:MAG: S9 family peptidase [Candidatus Aminicenantia bacterium]
MRKNLAGILVILLFITVGIYAEHPKRLEIKTMFDPQLLSKLSVPQYIWLNNGKILMLDPRVKSEERTIEIFDPSKKKREPMVDCRKVISSLKEHLGDRAPQTLRFPDAVDLNGKAIAYIINGDIFVVNLSTSYAKRLTNTEIREESISFSPDGNWIGFIRGNEIYVIEWNKGIEKRLTSDGSETILNGRLSWVYWEEIYDHTNVPYSWSPDSKAIAYLQTDESEVPISTFVNFEPVNQGVVRQRYTKAGQKNPKVKLGIVELETAKTTWVDCEEYEYIGRFNWLPNSKEIAVQTLNRKQNELKLFFVDRETGKSRLILTETQPAWINLNDSLYFFKNGKYFIWMSERDGFQHLYLYDINGKLINQLTKGEFMVVPSIGGIVSRNGGLVGVDEKRRNVYFTANKEALKERHLYRVDIKGKNLKKITVEKGVHAITFSPDMKFYLDAFSNSFTPPEFSLYKSDGKKILTFSPSAKEFLEELSLNYPEFFTFKTEDGLDLPATMIKPIDFDPAKKYPAIIYVYGGPGAQQVIDSWSSRIFWANILAREGYFYFVFEVRAGMGRSKETETSVYKQAYGIQNLKDILDGVKWIKKFPFIDEKRLGIWGGSGGGCTTLFVMTHSEVFKAGIALYPVSDWHFYDSIYTERYQSTPEDNSEGYRLTSSVLAAKNLKGKLLIVHGTYDDNVHPQNTEAFINELIKNNIQFEIMIYPWRKHGIGDLPARIHLYTLMLDFWKRNL